MDDRRGDIGEEVLAFGPFKLYRAQKALFDGDAPVRIGGRAIEILIALIERRGEVVGRPELLAIAWPDTSVEDSNLRVHIAALRKLLGDGQEGARYIVNVSGRGYSFVAPVIGLAPIVATPKTRGDVHLPGSLTHLIGRDGVVAALIDEFSSRRFVTVVGPGGMGKSTVAILVAERLAELRGYRARFIDLAAVEDGSAVAAAVATALGVTAAIADPVSSLMTHLVSQRMMLVFDNCEHVIEAVATIAERIVRHAPDIDLLMTSREPLLVASEWVHRLLPLDCPPNTVGLTAREALGYAAVQLFVERAMSSHESFTLDDAQASVVANVCRRLDGLPLAIELVAARADLFGVSGLEKALDDQLLFLSRGRRTSRPQQQSLRGTLDWSFALLTPAEQAILRRLAVFRGPFSLDAAVVAASRPGITTGEILEGVVSLAAKSLLAADASGPAIRYRLLHVTRVYALEKAIVSGEAPAVRRRHAQYLRDHFVAAVARWDILSRAEWLAEYGYMIDDVRAALDWAFSPEGDVEIGATLTAATLPIGYQMSLIDEFKMRANTALQALATLEPPQPIAELRIHCVLGWISVNTDMDQAKIKAEFGAALRLAKTVEGMVHRVEPLLGFTMYSLETGDYVAAGRFAEDLRACAVEPINPLGLLLADRATAQACHFRGDHERARSLAERVIRHPAVSVPLTFSQTSVDRRISMRFLLARTLWLEGRPEQARQLMQECMVLAYADTPFAICHSLALAACPIALWRGDDIEAERLIGQLLEYSVRFNLNRWRHFGEGYQNLLQQRRAKSATDREDAWLERCEPDSVMQHEILVTLDERMIDAAMIQRAADGVPSWCAPELLRTTGEHWLRLDKPESAANAEAFFHQAMALARQQNALSWELRAATSLARLWRQTQAADGQAILETVLSRFTEGHQTDDVKRATALFVELGAPVPQDGRVPPLVRH